MTNRTDLLHHSMVSRLKLRHLALLQALQLHRTISRVATEMRLTQPAVTKALKEIEDIFMARLFDRTARGLKPTAAGEAVLQYAQLSLADLDSTSRALNAIEAGLIGRLRVGVVPDIPLRLLSAMLSHLLDRTPRVAVLVREGGTTDMVAALSARELDCVIGRSHHHDQNIVQEIILHQVPCLLVSARSRARLSKGALDWQRLAALDWIMQPAGSPGRETVNAIFVNAEIPPPSPFVETHSLKTIEAVLRDAPNAITILSRDVATEFAVRGGCAILPYALEWNLAPISFFMSTETAQQQTVRGLGVAVRAAGLKLA